MRQSRENRQKFKSQITIEPKQLQHILAPHMKGWLIGHLLDDTKNSGKSHVTTWSRDQNLKVK